MYIINYFIFYCNLYYNNHFTNYIHNNISFIEIWTFHILFRNWWCSDHYHEFRFHCKRACNRWQAQTFLSTKSSLYAVRVGYSQEKVSMVWHLHKKSRQTISSSSTHGSIGRTDFDSARGSWIYRIWNANIEQYKLNLNT